MDSWIHARTICVATASLWLLLPSPFARAQDDCVVWYQDVDGDGFGNESVSQTECEGDTPSGFVNRAGDCDDADATVYYNAPELCDHADNDCNGLADDGLPLNTYWLDVDLDGYGATDSPVERCGIFLGHVDNDLDCDDGNGSIHPGADETCDGVDNDCDGAADEGALLTFYWDGDLDEWGTAISATTEFCSLGEANEGAVDGLWTEAFGDCDDDNDSVYPFAGEICDGVDNDCSGVTDDHGACDDLEPWGGVDPIDNDGDGFNDLGADGEPGTYDEGEDCDDTRADVYPGAPEICDDLDNDCDGLEDCSDLDGDGLIDAAEDTPCCDMDLDDYTELDGDCDDGDSLVYPGAYEYVDDDTDNDCNGLVDEDPMQDWDEDGFAEAEGDCNDMLPSVHPAQPEVPNDLIDNNCNGVIDEAQPIGWTCSLGAGPPSRALLIVLVAIVAAFVFRWQRGSVLLCIAGCVVTTAGCTEYIMAGRQTRPVVELLAPADGQRWIDGESAVALAFVYDRENESEAIRLQVDWNAWELRTTEGSVGAWQKVELATHWIDVSGGGAMSTLDIAGYAPPGTWRLQAVVTDYHGEATPVEARVSTIPNEPPVARILRPDSELNTIWYTGEPILLMGEVLDDHLPPEHLQATWEIGVAGSESLSVTSIPDQNGAVFTVQRVDEPGTVRATLTADDGVTASVQDEVLIPVVDPPGEEVE